MEYGILNRTTYFTLNDLVEGTELDLNAVRRAVEQLSGEGVLSSHSDNFRLNLLHQKTKEYMQEYGRVFCESAKKALDYLGIRT